MPDFSMCLAMNCPVSEGCARSPDSGTRPNPQRQSWTVFGPTDETGCAHFVQNQTEGDGDAES